MVAMAVSRLTGATPSPRIDDTTAVVELNCSLRRTPGVVCREMTIAPADDLRTTLDRIETDLAAVRRKALSA
jgi:hypothetical protein